MSKYWLAPQCEISEVEEPTTGRVALVSINDRRLYVGEAIYAILKAVKHGATKSQIVEDLSWPDRMELISREKYVNDIICKKLLPWGLVILENLPDVENKFGASRGSGPIYRANDYVSVSVTILRGAALKTISRLLSAAFSPVAIFIIGIVSLLVHGAWLTGEYWPGFTPSNHAQYLPHNLSEWIQTFGSTLLLLLAHEFGHAASAARYGVDIGRIGFGVYLIFPAFFCDVTGAWRLSRRKRVLIDLGGIYFQIIVGAIYIAMAISFDVKHLLVVAYLNIGLVVVNVNPFLRFDGYWLYSDAFDLPNLRSQSLDWIKRAFTAIRGRDGAMKNLFDRPALAIYSAMWVAFMVAFILYAATLLLSLPTTVSKIARQIIVDFVWARNFDDYLVGVVSVLKLVLVVAIIVAILKRGFGALKLRRIKSGAIGTAEEK